MSASVKKQNDELTVTGHLRVQNGIYQMVFSWHGGGIPKGSKQKTTGLPEKGNKRNASELLMEEKVKLKAHLLEQSLTIKEDKQKSKTTTVTIPQIVSNNSLINPNKVGKSLITADMLYSEYLWIWHNRRRISIEEDTWAADLCKVKIIAKYFEELEITVGELTEYDIEDFYVEQRKLGKSNNTIRSYHVIINKSLKDLFKKKEIIYNPVDLITNKPKHERYIGKTFNVDELQEVCRSLNGHLLEFGVYCAGYYGLRRSEIVGLQWPCFDFSRNLFLIDRAYISFYLNGQQINILKEKTKNDSSTRVLPIVPPFRDLLLRMKADQEKYRKLCGNCYNTNYLNYVYTDQMGNLIKPDYLTSGFKSYLARNGFKVIRFHDLRHTCASILYEYGVDMKKISTWLGHSNTHVTETIYAHFLSDPYQESKNVLVQTWA